MPDFKESARQQICTTLDLANRALAEIEQDVKHLAQRADDLRTFIRLGDAILGRTYPAETRVDTPPRALLTAAQKAQLVLADAGEVLSVDEIMVQLMERDLIQGQQRAAVKTALRNHPRIFTRHGRGVYGLAAWGTKNTTQEGKRV